MTPRLGCYNPSLLFKPQWAYATPAGYRDEPYLIPFTFNVLCNGGLVLNQPLSLDDDVPYVLRAIVFPAVGPFGGQFGAFNGVNFPGFVRIRDSHGNPLSDGLVLGAGAYGMSGFQNENAFGFPFEPEIECSPGGVLLFDFQLSSSGSFSSITEEGGNLMFFASLFGATGNGLTIRLINPGAPNVPLSVARVGGIHVQVTLATNGASVITSTLADVANIINTTPAIAAVMQAIVVAGAGGNVATAFAQTPLGAAVNGSVQPINGTLIGVKRFRDCL